MIPIYCVKCSNTLLKCLTSLNITQLGIQWCLLINESTQCTQNARPFKGSQDHSRVFIFMETKVCWASSFLSKVIPTTSSVTNFTPVTLKVTLKIGQGNPYAIPPMDFERVTHTPHLERLVLFVLKLSRWQYLWPEINKVDHCDLATRSRSPICDTIQGRCWIDSNK